MRVLWSKAQKNGDVWKKKSGVHITSPNQCILWRLKTFHFFTFLHITQGRNPKIDYNFLHFLVKRYLTWVLEFIIWLEKTKLPIYPSFKTCILFSWTCPFSSFYLLLVHYVFVRPWAASLALEKWTCLYSEDLFCSIKIWR